MKKQIPRYRGYAERHEQTIKGYCYGRNLTTEDYLVERRRKKEKREMIITVLIFAGIITTNFIIFYFQYCK